MRILLFSILLACFISSGSTYSEQVNEYIIKRAVESIEIDGALDEKEWEHASLTQPFVFYLTGELPRYQTQAQMLWDDYYLYIAVRMTDRDVWGVMVNHDDHLWKEEVTEIFIDPDGDGLNYIELEVNPLGTVSATVISLVNPLPQLRAPE